MSKHRAIESWIRGRAVILRSLAPGIAALVAGCSATTLSVSDQHPAHPEAAPAPVVVPAEVLHIDPEGLPALPGPPDDHAPGHVHEPHHGHGEPAPPPGEDDAHDHAHGDHAHGDRS